MLKLTYRVLAVFRLALVSFIIAKQAYAEVSALNGLEVRCGQVNMYFGDRNMYYSTPSISDFIVPDKSILDGTASDQLQLTIPYNEGRRLVRETGCGASDIFCEKEYISVSLKKAEAYLVHRKTLNFLSTPTSDPGISWQFLVTLMNHKISVRSGYSAEFEVHQRVTISEIQSEYFYSDNIGNRYHNNLWEDWRHKFRLGCVAL